MGLGLHASTSYFDVALKEDICIECVRNVPLSERGEHVGKITGQKIYKATSARGEKVCICESCLQKILNGVKQLENKVDFFDYDVETIIHDLKKTLGKKQWDIKVENINAGSEEVPLTTASNSDTQMAIFYINLDNHYCADIVGYYQFTGWLFHVVRAMLTLEILEYVANEGRKHVQRELIQIAWGIVILMHQRGLDKYLRKSPEVMISEEDLHAEEQK